MRAPQLFIFLILFGINHINAQNDSVNYADSNGLKQGVWKYYYPNGKLKSEKHFVNDTLFGVVTEYDEFGNTWFVGSYSRGKANGIVKQFYDNGILKSEIEYKNGRVWNTIGMFDYLGNRLEMGTVKNGSGLFMFYGGAEIFGHVYRDGVWTGYVKTFYQSGALKSEGWNINYENLGQTEKTETIEVDGENLKVVYPIFPLKEGVWKMYNEKGELIKTEVYEKGELISTK